MHIPEGVLSTSVLAAGGVVTAAGVAVGLRRMDEEQIPTVAVLSSAFFIASLIHVQLGPSSVHLLLIGLTGVVLGMAAFPAILIALFMQAVMFGFGGLTAIGVNTANMALPAAVCFYLFNPGIRRARGAYVFALGFAAGALAPVLACVMLSASLLATGKEFLVAVKFVLLAHLPIVAIEGFVTAAVVVFLRQVRPEVLGARLAATEEEAAHG